jgi:uncharacterized protein (DUF1800 family)
MPISTLQLRHLLSRTGVRVPAARAAQLQGLELQDAVDAVCNFSANPTWILPPRVEPNWEWGQLVRDQWLDHLATLPNPLEAKLALFWHGHFATALNKVGDAELMIDQYEKLRKLGPGPFETLAQAIAIDPAMLVYLDNHTNTKSSPNENFARELMELFTLGANRGYTQEDVREMARAWSGYGTYWDGDHSRYRYYPTRHDDGQKTLFGITKAWTGPEAISEMCTGVRRQTTAEFITGKLWAFFAYEGPDAGLLASLASDYLAEGMHTLNFLRRMFKRDEFYSDRALQGRVKSPIEWGCSVIGAVGLKSRDVWLTSVAGGAGHDLMNPPNVAGWKLNNTWMSESVYWAQEGLAQTVTWLVLGNPDFASNSTRARVQGWDALTPEAAVADAAALYGLALSGSTRNTLEKWVIQHRSEIGWGMPNVLLRLMSITTEARLA